MLIFLAPHVGLSLVGPVVNSLTLAISTLGGCLILEEPLPDGSTVTLFLLHGS